MARKVLLVGLICLAAVSIARGQDTVRISLQKFMGKGLSNAGKVQAAKQKVRLAANKVDQVKGKRFLSSFVINTQNGIIPGVKSSREDLSPSEYYLDPNLRNDFTDYSIFTRVHLKVIQPIFTWGALRDAINAAKSAAQAAESKLKITKDKIRLRLYKLYQSYLLSLELKRLVNKAQHTIATVNNKLRKKKK